VFLPDDQVKILFCPEAQELNGEQATVITKTNARAVDAYPSQDMDSNFVPTQWEKDKAFWLVKHNNSGRIVAAFVRHIVTIGDPIIVGKPEPIWRELQGKTMRLESISRRKYGVRTSKGFLALLEDIRPMKMEPAPTAIVKPYESGVSKVDIAAAAVAIAGANNIIDSDIGELLKQLGVSLVDDADLTVSTYVDLSLRLDVNYPKGIEPGDKTAIAKAMAEKFKNMPTSDLVELFIEYIATVEV